MFAVVYTLYKISKKLLGGIMIESWRVIEKAPAYSVSDQGRVWNRRFDKELKPWLGRHGYPSVELAIDGTYPCFYVHRLVLEAFSDEEHDTLQVNHIDGVKTNNFRSNLEWVTPSENMRHARSMGLLVNVGIPKVPVRIVETNEVFKSLSDCARAIGGRPSSIWHCLHGRTQSYMNYTFEFVDD